MWASIHRTSGFTGKWFRFKRPMLVELRPSSGFPLSIPIDRAPNKTSLSFHAPLTRISGSDLVKFLFCLLLMLNDRSNLRSDLHRFPYLNESVERQGFGIRARALNSTLVKIDKNAWVRMYAHSDTSVFFLWVRQVPTDKSTQVFVPRSTRLAREHVFGIAAHCHGNSSGPVCCRNDGGSLVGISCEATDPIRSAYFMLLYLRGV